MTPREVWCNESQERYVLAIAPDSLDALPLPLRPRALPVRRRGRRHGGRRLVVGDPLFGNQPVDMDLPALLGKPPRMTRDVARRAAAAPAVPRRGHRPRGGGPARPAPPRRGRQDVPRHDRRPHRRRPLLARPDGRAVAGAGRRLRDDAPLVRRLRGRGVRHGRALADRGDRRARLGPHGRGRGPHEPRRGPGRVALARQALRQLDGGRGLARRGRGALRHREGGGARPLPAARRRHPRRQGLDVDAHDLEGAAASAGRSSARSRSSSPPSRRARTCARRGRRSCAPTPGRPTSSSSTSAGRKRASAARSSPRCSARPASEAPDLDDPERIRSLYAALAELRGGPSSSRTTTAPTAGSSRRSPRWPSPAAPASRSTSARSRTGGRHAAACSRPSSTRSWASSLQTRARRPCARAARSSPATACPATSSGAPSGMTSPCGSRAAGACSSRAPRSALHRLWSETTWQMQTLRDNPESARQEYDRILDVGDPGLSPRPLLRPRRRRRGAVRRPGRAAAHRDPARAGRERPGRDGGRASTAPASRPSTST